MRKTLTTLCTAAMLSTSSAALATEKHAGEKPTIVLVHGAFAGSSSWNRVISKLEKDNFPVVAVANPLRGLATDADYVARVVHDIPGPVVLVGHSYGGEVISMAAVGSQNVTALVFVAGLAPEPGESAASLGMRFPTGTLDQSLATPILQADGAKDLYISQAKYWAQFAADVPKAEAVEMGATQRPVTAAALAEPAGPGAWKSVPSWFIWGSKDKNIPNTLHAFMAQRAHAREAIEVKGASHVVMISHSQEVAAMIERAAATR